MPDLRNRIVVFCFLVIVPFFSGCDPGTRPISGMVTFKSQPVKEGLVTLVPIDGTRARGAAGLVKDGKYKIESKFGVVPGRYRVNVEAVNLDKVIVKASAESDVEYAELFPPYTFDHEFGGKAPFVLDIDVPGK